MRLIILLLLLFSSQSIAQTRSGQWSPVEDWPFVAIHAAVLFDGRIMTYGSDGDAIPNSNIGGRGRTGAFLYDIWDPETSSHLTLPNTTQTDLFCSAQILLPTTGEMLIVGGDTYTPKSATNPVDTNDNLANNNSTILSGQNGSYNVSSGQEMNLPRWYATPSTLPNGDIYIQGGRGGRGGPSYPEVITPSSSPIQSVDYQPKPQINTTNYDYWYPRNFVAPDGRIFGFGASTVNNAHFAYKAGDMYSVWPDGAGYLEPLGQINAISNTSGSSDLYSSTVMYADGKALHVSAQDDKAMIIDFNHRTPIIRETGNLSGQRKWLTLTLLADGEVLATGGSEVDGRGKNIGGSVGQIYNSAEIWDPTTGAWTVDSSAQEARLYHSIAILLPDARVLAAGGGLSGPFTQHNAEIYSPPYLFEASGSGNLAQRPQILSGPSLADYSEMITIFVDDTNIQKLTLVKSGSVTHSFNVEQRIIQIPSSELSMSGQSVTFRAPSDPNIATPGYYMVFAINNNGVPSKALMLKLSGNSDFEITENAGIPGFNASTLIGLTTEACKQACVDNASCKSADYRRSDGTCFLQEVNSDTQSLNLNYAGDPYDHFSYSPRRDFVELFGMVANAGIPGHNQETLYSLTVDQCLSGCNERKWCKSVDFARDTGSCYLQPVAEEDVSELNTNYPGNPFDHYFFIERLNDNFGWEKVENAGIPGHNIETHHNQSVAACQHLCEQESWCMTVDFRRSNGTCYLQDVSNAEAGLRYNYTGNPFDHYFSKSRLRGAEQLGFTSVPNSYLPGYGLATLTDTSLEECQNACAVESSCKSVDFRHAQQLCYLQNGDSSDGPLNTSAIYDHYQKSNL